MSAGNGQAHGGFEPSEPHGPSPSPEPGSQREHAAAPPSESRALETRYEPPVPAPSAGSEPHPVAHFEPSPSSEGGASPGAAKPYVVWSSAPPESGSTPRDESR